MIKSVTAEQLKARLGELTIIDVRTPAEFKEVRVQGVIGIPLNSFDPESVLRQFGDKELYLICKSGGRSKTACEKLIAAGAAVVFNVEGGTQACEAAGLPVERG